VSSFESNDGRLCLLLSDGSGCGESARRESALTSRLLRQFLEAGIDTEAALKTLNAAMALRSEETGAFSTIDLITVSLGNGDAALYKYGAAPTYIKKGGSVRRITGHALPPGLRESASEPDITRLTLKEESFVVMISDGVADPTEDEWLQDLLAGWDGSDPQLLAGLILQETVRRGELMDDCGVQVLYFPAEEKLAV
jgi:stage II sporulation protein E